MLTLSSITKGKTSFFSSINVWCVRCSVLCEAIGERNALKEKILKTFSLFHWFRSSSCKNSLVERNDVWRMIMMMNKLWRQAFLLWFVYRIFWRNVVIWAWAFQIEFIFVYLFVCFTGEKFITGWHEVGDDETCCRTQQSPQRREVFFDGQFLVR